MARRGLAVDREVNKEVREAAIEVGEGGRLWLRQLGVASVGVRGLCCISWGWGWGWM